MEELLNQERDLIEQIENTKQQLDLLKQELVSVKNNINTLRTKNKTSAERLAEILAEFPRGEQWSDDVGVTEGRRGRSEGSASGIMRYKKHKTKRRTRKYRRTNRKGKNRK